VPRISDLSLRERESGNKVYGVVCALVTNIVDDKQNGYRIKVRFPCWPNGGQQNSEESDWCRMASFMAGPDRGAVFMPEVGDEVLVAFENGDVASPIVLGMLWNGSDKVPYSNNKDSGPVKDCSFQGKTEAKKNDLRFIRSRKGHQLIMNDNADEPRVALHSGKKHRIVLDDKDDAFKIEIYDGKEENYILVDNKNKKIMIETTTGEIHMKAKDKITLEAQTIILKKDDQNKMQLDSNFDMKSGGTMTMKSSGQGEVNAGGQLVVKGSQVNIN
jgi:uncharacterized protein involved in type VI secretion and phage assembly